MPPKRKKALIRAAVCAQNRMRKAAISTRAATTPNRNRARL